MCAGQIMYILHMFLAVIVIVAMAAGAIVTDALLLQSTHQYTELF